MLTGEHFTNFFLDCLPQLAVGLAEKYATPDGAVLKMDGHRNHGEPGLAITSPSS